MISPKPKVRKVAWVVLGVVVVAAAVTVSMTLDTAWYSLAYEERATLEIVSTTLGRTAKKTAEREVITLNESWFDNVFGECPPNAVQIRLLVKKRTWLPGARATIVYHGEQGEVISYSTLRAALALSAFERRPSKGLPVRRVPSRPLPQVPEPIRGSP